MTRPNSVILYRGPSAYTGAPIVVVLSGLKDKSANRKTGNMLQTWIVADHIRPVVALQSGEDKAVCGGCPLRNAGCYVNVGQAPTAVYQAVQRGTIPVIMPEELPTIANGRMVRLGSYGDPAAVPEAIWSGLLASASGWTGYTHGWRSPRFTHLQKWCMASVETERDQTKAQSAGWGTFHVRAVGDTTVTPGQIRCPASAEAGHKATCETCGMCNGQSGRQVVILAHGAKANRVGAREV